MTLNEVFDGFRAIYDAKGADFGGLLRSAAIIMRYDSDKVVSTFLGQASGMDLIMMFARFAQTVRVALENSLDDEEIEDILVAAVRGGLSENAQPDLLVRKPGTRAELN